MDGEALRCGHVCAHTHLYSGLAPLGMPAPEPTPENFVQILERVWWRLDRALDRESLRAAARLYVAEALLAGTTTLIDHHESPDLIEGSLDVLAEACAELGARALLCFGATERNGGRDEARRGLAECRRFIESGPPEGVVGAVALHASFTVSDETIREAGELCRELGTVMHVHLAEDAADVANAKCRGYVGPLERLEALGALPIGSILAHGVHLGPGQVRHAESLGCWFVHNPRSNLGNAVGYATHLVESERVALGTDGYPAQMKAELAALWAQAEANGQEPLSTTYRLPRGRTLAAERFGGSFELRDGAHADLVLEGPEGPRHVLVGGRLVVRDGRLVNGDLEAIRAEAQTQADRLWSRMRAL